MYYHRYTLHLRPTFLSCLISSSSVTVPTFTCIWPLEAQLSCVPASYLPSSPLLYDQHLLRMCISTFTCPAAPFLYNQHLLRTCISTFTWYIAFSVRPALTENVYQYIYLAYSLFCTTSTCWEDVSARLPVQQLVWQVAQALHQPCYLYCSCQHQAYKPSFT